MKVIGIIGAACVLLALAYMVCRSIVHIAEDIVDNFKLKNYKDCFDDSAVIIAIIGVLIMAACFIAALLQEVSGG